MAFTNQQEKLALLKHVNCFALDMDGTFYLGENLLPGAFDFLNFVRASGRRVIFLTNNSSRNGGYYVQKLKRLQCDVPIADIYTSGMATCRYLNQSFPGKRVFLLGNEYLKEEFRQYGILLDDENPEMAVIGFDTTLDYAKMWKLCDCVRAGLPYIATHPDFNCPTETGFMPDIGATIAYVEASTGRRPDVVVGKPYAGIVEGMLEYAGVRPEELCICGDRLYTDVATGVNHGILAVCVLSGESTLEDVEASSVKPDLLFNGIYDIVQYL